MKRSDVKALYYICHIENLPSIIKDGILCYNKAKKLRPETIYNPDVQERRKNKLIPFGRTGKKLHDYANLYFNPRNAMMYAIRNRHMELCVLLIDADILDNSDVVVSDGNASSDHVRFYSTQYLDDLVEESIFAKGWTHPNRIEYYRRKSAVCAEVLVPSFVPSNFITGIYVSCNESREKVKRLLEDSPLQNEVFVNNDLFFQW